MKTFVVEISLPKTQITSILKQLEAALAVKDLTGEYTISKVAFYNSKVKNRRLGTQGIKWLKELEQENNRLKGIVGNLTLENDSIQNLSAKKRGRTSSPISFILETGCKNDVNKPTR